MCYFAYYINILLTRRSRLRGYLHETGTNSDLHEFVSTSIQFFLCVYMRPAWQWTQTGLTSSRLLDRDEKFSYRSEFAPFSCKWQQISDRVQKFQACMLLGQRYIYLTKHVILSRNQAPSISSRFHVNSCKNFIPVWVHTGLSSSRSHVNTSLVHVSKRERVAIYRANDVLAADWLFQTQVKNYPYFSRVVIRFFSVVEIPIKHSSLYIYSLRHRNCGVRGYILELFVWKPERASEGFWHKKRVNITPYKAISMTWAVYST